MRSIRWFRRYEDVLGELGRGGGMMCWPGGYGPEGTLGIVEVMVVRLM